MENRKSWFNDYLENFTSEKEKDDAEKIVSGFVRWKQNVHAASWKKDFYPDGKCPKCGSADLIHSSVEWEGRESLFHICPSVWRTDCPACKTQFMCVSNDEGELIDTWTDDI